MARIESEATDSEVISRLGKLLERSEKDNLSTTCALGFSTAIFVWVAQRVRRKGDPFAEALMARWSKTGAGERPWRMPGELGNGTVYDALIRLRNASAHAEGSRVKPWNDEHGLVGFYFEAHRDPIALHEQDLRRFGVLIAQEFSAQMRAAEPQT